MVLVVQMLFFASVSGDCSRSSFCASREVGCSSHGECHSTGTACLCDPGYEGERCDVWRAALSSPSLLTDVEWLNCTHGRPAGNRSAVVQLCTLDEKGVCEAAGAPTVPPPDWDGVCFDKPTKPRSYGKSVCQPDIEGIATVVKGLSGSFCAMPCMTKSQASCEGCPDDGCQVKNDTTGQCVRCASSCKDQPEFHSAPCDAREEMVCPCGGGTDAAGQPLLARPQCVATDCGPYPNDLQRRPLCALTCDPDAAVPPGRHNCQPGATCERVPNASFTPAGICTWPMDNTIAPYVPGVPSPSEPAVQKPGWSWSAAHGAQGLNACPTIQVPRYSCVANSSTSKAYCVPLGNSTHYFTYPTMGAEGDPPCGGHCSALPPNAVPPLMPPHCHPAPPPPPPPTTYRCSGSNGTCVIAPSGDGAFTNKTVCEATCSAPPPPLGTNPCIRFGHALPVDHLVDIVITQDPHVTHTWSGYKFGQFSDWVNVFTPGSGACLCLFSACILPPSSYVGMIRHRTAGANSSWQRGDYGRLRSLCILQLPAKCCRAQRTYLSVHRADASCWNALICIDTGTITVYESISGGGRGKQLYTKQIPLTPGPLVVVLKVASDQNPVRNDQLSRHSKPAQSNITHSIGWP